MKPMLVYGVPAHLLPPGTEAAPPAEEDADGAATAGAGLDDRDFHRTLTGQEAE